jgi:hypothetical protein
MSADPSMDDGERLLGSYGIKGAAWGALSGVIVSGALFWLTDSYLSFAAVPIFAAYGYWLRPGIRDPGSMKSRW